MITNSYLYNLEIKTPTSFPLHVTQSNKHTENYVHILNISYYVYLNFGLPIEIIDNYNLSSWTPLLHSFKFISFIVVSLGLYLFTLIQKDVLYSYIRREYSD